MQMKACKNKNTFWQKTREGASLSHDIPVTSLQPLDSEGHNAEMNGKEMQP